MIAPATVTIGIACISSKYHSSTHVHTCTHTHTHMYTHTIPKPSTGRNSLGHSHSYNDDSPSCHSTNYNAPSLPPRRATTSKAPPIPHREDSSLPPTLPAPRRQPHTGSSKSVYPRYLDWFSQMSVHWLISPEVIPWCRLKTGVCCIP